MVCGRSRYTCRLRDRWERGGQNHCEDYRGFLTSIHPRIHVRHPKRPGGYLGLVSSDNLGPSTTKKRPVRIKATTWEPKAPPASATICSCTWTQRAGEGGVIKVSWRNSWRCRTAQSSRAVLLLHIPIQLRALLLCFICW